MNRPECSRCFLILSLVATGSMHATSYSNFRGALTTLELNQMNGPSRSNSLLRTISPSSEEKQQIANGKIIRDNNHPMKWQMAICSSHSPHDIEGIILDDITTTCHSARSKAGSTPCRSRTDVPCDSCGLDSYVDPCNDLRSPYRHSPPGRMLVIHPSKQQSQSQSPMYQMYQMYIPNVPARTFDL